MCGRSTRKLNFEPKLEDALHGSSVLSPNLRMLFVGVQSNVKIQKTPRDRAQSVSMLL